MLKKWGVAVFAGVFTLILSGCNGLYYVKRGRSALQSGDIQKARECLAKAVALNPVDTDPDWRDADQRAADSRQYEEVNKFQKEIDNWRKEKDGDAAQTTQAEQPQVEVQPLRDPAGLSLPQSLVASNDQGGTLVYNKAKQLAEAGKVDAAYKKYDEGLVIFPSSDKLMLGYLKMDQKNHHEISPKDFAEILMVGYAIHPNKEFTRLLDAAKPDWRNGFPGMANDANSWASSATEHARWALTSDENVGEFQKANIGFYIVDMLCRTQRNDRLRLYSLVRRSALLEGWFEMRIHHASRIEEIQQSSSKSDRETLKRQLRADATTYKFYLSMGHALNLVAIRDYRKSDYHDDQLESQMVELENTFNGFKQEGML